MTQLNGINLSRNLQLLLDLEQTAASRENGRTSTTFHSPEAEVQVSATVFSNAGDQYIGLDRFGRIVDQRWIKTSDRSHTDRFKYGYDRDSNRLYRENLVNAAFSELYHADGASAGYDNLNQLVEFQRGTLSDANSDRGQSRCQDPFFLRTLFRLSEEQAS